MWIDLPGPDTLRPMLDEALRIVDETDDIARSGIARGFTHRTKDDRTLVTDVDISIEQHVRQRLGVRFPDHVILGEELGGDERQSEWRWVVDPIDGTKSLRHRIPLFGTLLALEHEGRTVIGVISLPMLEDRVWAAAGSGAWRNGVRLPSDDISDLRDEVIATGDRRQFANAGCVEAFDRLMSAHDAVRTYSDCFGHLLALRGAVAAMVDYDLRAWDAAPTRIIAKEAGCAYRERARQTADGPRFDLIFGRPLAVGWAAGVMGLDP